MVYCEYNNGPYNAMWSLWILIAIMKHYCDSWEKGVARTEEKFCLITSTLHSNDRNLELGEVLPTVIVMFKK